MTWAKWHAYMESRYKRVPEWVALAPAIRSLGDHQLGQLNGKWPRQMENEVQIGQHLFLMKLLGGTV